MCTHHEALCGPAASRVVRLERGNVTIEERLVDLSEPAQLVADVPRLATTKVKTIEELLNDVVPGEPEPHQLIKEEAREQGSIKWGVYRLFLKSSGIWLWVALALALLGEQAGEVAQRWLLKVWSEGGRARSGPFKGYPPPDVDVDPWLLAYLGVFLVGRAILTTRNILAVAGSYRAARVLFSTCLAHVVRARTRWFDTTPSACKPLPSACMDLRAPQSVASATA
jgi:hypothetical protein